MDVLRVGQRLLITTLAMLLVVWAAPAGGQEVLETFERDHLVIATASGERHSFEIELALTAAQQRQGLMFRQRLAAEAGMLFVYEPAREVGMWMVNTLVPLDMLFIEGDGTIIKVVERTVPLSRRIIASDRPVAGVLEVNAGTVARLGIEAGDRVLYPAFGKRS